jgi:hypothetical protein
MAKARIKKVAKVDTTGFRVYRLPKSLRVAVSKSRAAQDRTVASFVESAVSDQLESVVQDLRLLFHGKHAGPRGPVRLPIGDSQIASLRAASKLGLPASLLLELCLSRAAATPAKRTRRTR